MSRVLMVDDAGLFQILEGTFLRRTGCAIVRAGSAADLLDKARDAAPDLILIDAGHPDLDGPACVQALKAAPALRDIPILVVAEGDRLQECRAAGADATVTRPLRPGDLEAALCALGRVARREGIRSRVRVMVRVASAAGEQRARLKDISRTGAFLALPEPPPVESRVLLSLRLESPTGTRRVRTRGVVVRCVTRDAASHLIAGVGVRFIELDPSSQSVIEDYLCAPRSAPPPEPGAGTPEAGARS